jgi:cytochrome c oxidase assembly factor CtaG
MLSVPLAASADLSSALQLGPLAILALLYARRVRALAGGGHPVPGWRQACFYTGFVLIGAALSSLDSASDELLYAHMVEHLLLGDVAALLIVLGLTAPLLAPVLRIQLFDRLRRLSHPLIAFPLWAVDLYVWHLPFFYQAALRHPTVHALEHAMFLGFGVNMWMCLFGPLPMPRGSGISASSCTSSPCASPARSSATSSSGRARSSIPSTCTETPCTTSRRWPTRASRGRS